MDEIVEEQLIKEYGEELTSDINKGCIPKYTTIRCNVDKSLVMNTLDDNNIEYE